MSVPRTVVLRRSWTQRLVILCSLGVVAGALIAAWFINDVYVSVSTIGRVQISGEILFTDTAPGGPVNFLLIGQDSALGLDPDDPAAFARELDPRGRFQADSIAIVRVDPTSGQVWVLSIPRDLLVDVGGGRMAKINSTLLIEDPSLLVRSINETFGIELNHFITLDFLGFRQLIDELDGVPVWFNNPARDFNNKGENRSGLVIETAGCHVLDGVAALNYVRSRWYQEFIDGDWEYVGRRDDFGRISRQQDFMVLMLDRAIDRGARSPVTLAALVKAGATSIVLDDELTIAELVEVGEAFTDFDPANLQRLSLTVTNVGTGQEYKGEQLVDDVNEPVFAVFRGESDLPSPSAVEFDLYASADADIAQLAIELEARGFTMSRTLTLDSVEGASVIVHPPDQRAAAESIARWLEPIPRFVEDPDAESLSLILGQDHEQIFFLYPHEISETREAVAAHADGGLPDLSSAQSSDTTTSTLATTTTTTLASDADSAATTTTTTATATTTTTSQAPIDELSTPTTAAGVIGRPPADEKCG